MLPKGFTAGGVHCGIAKKQEKKDLALFVSAAPCTVAGMFTSNLAKAAPVIVSAKHLKANANGIRAVVANSGCANACTGDRGMKDAEEMCSLVAKALGVKPEAVLAGSTGVIGQFLPIAKIRKGIKELIGPVTSGAMKELTAVEAIMTTDTVAKIAERTVTIGKSKVTVWGCVKGAGMIHPSLNALHATMLSFILTDAAIDGKLLDGALQAAVKDSFNCVSVDGDTSTNDTLVVLANGASGAKKITAAGKEYKVFAAALFEVCLELAKKIAADGEGATRMVEIEVKNAKDEEGARKIAATIATSPLVKTAIFGTDANWGRVIAAAGRAGVPFNPDLVDIYFGNMLMCRKGMANKFSEAKAKQYLQKKELKITLDLHQGKKSGRYYTCDFSLDYVKINADYRS